MWFEDYAVGQRFDLGQRVLTSEDLQAFARLSGDTSPLHTDVEHARTTQFGRPLVHAPFGLAMFFGQLWASGIFGDRIVAALDSNWKYLLPMFTAEPIRFEMLITRVRRTSKGDRGVVNRHVRLRDAEGAVIQEGSTAAMVLAKGPGPDQPGRAFGTVAWGEQLAARLNRNDTFCEAARTFDGTIGLAAGADEVHLRMYRGQIIEVSRRAPMGATFTVQGEDIAWTELVLGDRNEFVVRAARGEFQTVGDGYQYLRLTKSMSQVWDAVRDLAGASSRP